MTTVLVNIKDLLFSYPSQSAEENAWSLRVDRLTIAAGTMYRILGSNMAGKTTLLRIVAGLETVFLADQTFVDGALFSKRRGRRVVALAPRNTCFLAHDDRMFPDLTLWDNVRIARSSGEPLARKVARSRFDSFLNSVEMLKGKSARFPLGALSSGGRALIRLARAHTWKSQLILIDEVTAHLDDQGAETFFYHLKALVGAGCAVLMVSHVSRDHDLAQKTANDIGVKCSSFTITTKDQVSCLEEL